MTVLVQMVCPNAHEVATVARDADGAIVFKQDIRWPGTVLVDDEAEQWIVRVRPWSYLPHERVITPTDNLYAVPVRCDKCKTDLAIDTVALWEAIQHSKSRRARRLRLYPRPRPHTEVC